MEVQSYNGLSELSQAAATMFTHLSKRFIENSGRFTVALSGGSTPKEMYRILASAPYSELIEWEKIFFFWGDERCVPFESQKNNARMAFDNLFNLVPVPLDNIYPVPTHLPPEQAARAYESTLGDFFGNEQIPSFDLILLGLGEDGHTASLFPHTPVLHETGRLVSEVYVKEIESYRVTLTAHVINEASNIVFLVSGANKAWTFHRVTKGEFNPEHLPAQLIRPKKGKLYWLVDKNVAPGL